MVPLLRVFPLGATLAGGRSRAAARLAVLLPCLLAGCITTPLHEQAWTEVRSPHFVIVSNGGAERAEEVALTLERFRAVVLRVTNAADIEPRVPTVIYAFKDGYSFNRFKPGMYVAGYLIPRLYGNYVALNSSLHGVGEFEVIFHEYTHFLLRNQGTHRYPTWYDEGFAELLASVRFDESAVAVGRRLKSRSDTLARGDWLPLGKILFAENMQSWPPEDVSKFYAQSWLVTHFLHAGHLRGYANRATQLSSYLSMLNESSEPEEAFEQAFDTSVAQIERELVQYAVRGGLPYFELPLSEFDVERDFAVRALPLHEALHALGDLANQIGKPEMAADLLERALAAEPGHARTYEALAWARVPGDVEELWRKGLELGADDVVMQRSYASYLAYRVRRAREGEGETLSEADQASLLAESREHYRRALELDPAAPATHAGLGITYTLEDGDPGPGILALEEARSMLRWSTSIALALGELYKRAGYPGRARRLLGEVLAWATRGPEAERARELLDELDQAAPAAAEIRGVGPLDANRGSRGPTPLADLALSGG